MQKTLIRPNQSWFYIDLDGLRAYTDLLWLLVRREFIAKYKQTILGPIWFFVNPLITTLVFTLVFNRVIGVPTDGVPPMLFYLSGMLGWTYFSTVLGSTSNSLAGNAGLFSKVYFPRLIPPLAATISSALPLVIQFLTFVGFYTQHLLTAPTTQVTAPSWLWLLFPLLLLHMSMLGLGVGLLLSSLTAKYRDFAHIQGFLVNLWMYATPVIYPLSKIPQKWQWVVSINPMSPVTEATRLIFLGVGTVHLSSYLLSLTLSFALLFVGLFTYQYSARSFVDTV